jgi:hypothetical protein
VKSRVEAARFIEKQMHWSYKNVREKSERVHYGWQDLRELMDFIYEGLPTTDEALTELDDSWLGGEKQREVEVKP